MITNSAFIKNLFVEKYKSLRQTKIVLNNGINIIIGKNGSGKSNLLEFMERYVKPTVFNTIIGFNKISYRVQLENSEKQNFLVTIEKTKHISKDADEKNFSIVASIKDIDTNKTFTYNDEIFNSDESKLNNSNRKMIRQTLLLLNKEKINYNTPAEIAFLSTSIDYLIDSDSYWEYETTSKVIHISEVIAYYLELTPERETQNFKNDILNEKLKEYLKSVISNQFHENLLIDNLSKYSPIQSVRLNENFSIFVKGDEIAIDNLRLEFLINNEWLPWNFLSDGTKRLFIIISTFIENGNNIFLIEEPELGIYPDQLFLLLDFLREQAEHKQIIITTHSPMVLDMLNPKELDKINICTITEKGTRFKKLTAAQKKKAKLYMEEVGDLSSYWIHSDLV